jgi:hypothetical protein
VESGIDEILNGLERYSLMTRMTSPSSSGDAAAVATIVAAVAVLESRQTHRCTAVFRIRRVGCSDGYPGGGDVNGIRDSWSTSFPLMTFGDAAESATVRPSTELTGEPTRISTSDSHPR